MRKSTDVHPGIAPDARLAATAFRQDRAADPSEYRSHLVTSRRTSWRVAASTVRARTAHGVCPNVIKAFKGLKFDSSFNSAYNPTPLPPLLLIDPPRSGPGAISLELLQPGGSGIDLVSLPDRLAGALAATGLRIFRAE